MRATEMSRFALLAFVVGLGTLSGCSKQSTDTEVAASIAALEQAVAEAEREVERLKDFDAIENLSSDWSRRGHGGGGGALFCRRDGWSC